MLDILEIICVKKQGNYVTAFHEKSVIFKAKRGDCCKIKYIFSL